MKKSFCIFIIFAILSSYIFVNADSALYTCSPRINGYIQYDILIFDFELSDNMPNEKFLIAAYRNNKLEKTVFYTVDKIRSINDKKRDDETKEIKSTVVHIPYEITPDVVKIFALNDNIIPVCEKTVFFETSEDISAINSTVVTKLEEAAVWLEANKAKFKPNIKEKTIVNTYLIPLVKDAITKEQSFILSREFVLRNYKTELDSIMDIYNSMTTGDGGEQSIFYNHMGGLPNLDYVIKYLGLSSLLP